MLGKSLAFPREFPRICQGFPGDFPGNCQGNPSSFFFCYACRKRMIELKDFLGICQGNPREIPGKSPGNPREMPRISFSFFNNRPQSDGFQWKSLERQ